MAVEQQERALAAEVRVRELEAERDEWKGAAESQAEHARGWTREWRKEYHRARQAEARVEEIEAERDQAREDATALAYRSVVNLGAMSRWRKQAEAAEAEVARYRASLSAHHNIATLSTDVIAESIGGPCQVCARAQAGFTTGDVPSPPEVARRVVVVEGENGGSE